MGLRVAYWLLAQPNPDEAYYWLWGQHLDWSYYDHPPLHGWIQGLTAAVLGQARWVLRLPTVVSSGIFFGTYFRICRQLYGQQGRLAFGVLLTALLSSPLYFVYLAMAWQDQWLMVFSLLSAFGLGQFLSGYLAGAPHYGQLYWAALWLGLAGLCKYTAVLVGLAGLGVVVTQARSLLRQKQIYGAVAIALLCQLPILIWNAQNSWLSVAYYLTRSVDSGSAGFRIKPLEVLGFWGLCGLILSPVITWALWRCYRSGRLAQCPPVYRAMALWLFGVSTGTLSVVALFSTALHYWNILAYLLLLPLLPSFFLSLAPASVDLHLKWRRRRHFQTLQGIGITVALALVFNVAALPLAALAGPDGDHESRILYGWPQVADVIEAQLAERPVATLVTTDYRSAALLAYALRQSPTVDPAETVPVLAISDRKDQFDVWATRQSLPSGPVLILADDWHPITDALVEQLGPLSNPATIPIQRWGIFIKTYRLYTGQAQ